MATKPTLGYWDRRGMAGPIRLLLHYKGVKFEDKRYSLAHKEEWFNNKFNLGLDFPNLPYYIDGDVKLSQTLTILRYLGHKHQLDGDSEEQKLAVSLVEQQLVDFRFCLFFHIMKETHLAEKEEYLKKASEHLRLLERFLANTKFLTGDTLTYVDFQASEVLDFHRLYTATIFDDFPKLKDYHQRMKNLPELQEYLHSSTYKRWPVFGPLVKFGFSGEEPAHA